MPFVARSGFSPLLGFSMAPMLIFLQEGFTYYFSFQTLALLLVVVLIFKSKPSLVNVGTLLLIFLALFIFVGTTGAFSPMVVSRNTSNIFFSIVALLTYALMIISFLSIVPKRADLILYVFKHASSATIFILAALITLTDLSLLPFLNRSELLMQNSRLVTNFTGEDALIEHMEYLSKYDGVNRLDLFYGEPSYLGVVLFSCVVCYILTSRLISNLHYIRGESATKSSSSNAFYWGIVWAGVVSMLYLQSLSSIVYALVILYFEFGGAITKRISLLKLLALFLFVVIIVLFLSQSFEYLLYRVTMQDSLSLLQRFGSLSDFQIHDYIFGLKSESRMPDEGFHNGLFYIIAISGFAGIWYVFSLLQTVYRLAKPIKMSVLLMLVILALIMQNGAVFSPNKVVLFSLILLPLACARVIYPRKKRAFYSGVV